MSSMAADATPQRAALAARASVPLPLERTVSYRAPGMLLVTGRADVVAPLLRRLPADVNPLAVVTGTMPRDAPPRAVRVIPGRVVAVSGWLGRFEATVAGRDGAVDLAPFGPGDGFDLVLDLSEPPLISRAVLPPGYFAPCSDDELGAALRALSEIRREKPVYFADREELCARGSQGVSGCTRCLAGCPAAAIHDEGDQIRVEPFLCQGCGTCTAACPSGALSYAHPPREHTDTVITAMLHAFHEGGGRAATLAIHGGWTDPRALDDALASAAAWVLPLAVDSTPSVGIELWFAALADGAARVVLVPSPSASPQVVDTLCAQVAAANAILEGVSPGPERVTIVRAATHAEAVTRVAALERLEARPATRPRGSRERAEKRTLLFEMLDHLGTRAGAGAPIALGPDAPFGAVHVDLAACTVCLACAHLCPTQALFAPSSEEPRLAFVEARCVQCGICERGCPEHAIRLEPRLMLDWAQRNAPRELARGEAIRCSDCGVAFMNRRVLNTLLERLRGHPDLATEEGRARLGLCPACRQRATLLPPGAR